MPLDESVVIRGRSLGQLGTRAPKPFSAGRVCARAKCGTRLSIYNGRGHCHVCFSAIRRLEREMDRYGAAFDIWGNEVTEEELQQLRLDAGVLVK